MPPLNTGFPNKSVYSRTPLESEVVNFIIDSRNSESKEEAKKLLDQAHNICKQANSFDNPKIPSLKLEVLTEITTDMDSSEDRHALWESAVNEGFSVLDSNSEIDYAIQLYRKIVDFSQDQHLKLKKREITSLIAKATKSLDSLIPTVDMQDRGQLLTCKASLLRNLSQYQTTRISEKKISDKAIRCASKGLGLLPDSWDALLQLALCHWHSAQYEKDEKSYISRLERTESLIWRSIEQNSNRINTLALAQYFRKTYQSLPFIKAYEEYSLLENNKRQYYRGSFLFAEAALQLHYGKYPKSIVDVSLESAERLLEKSINAGCGDARHIIDLAFLKAARGEVSVGLKVVKLLNTSGEDLSWNQIAEVVSDRRLDNDLLSKGFALGIEQSGTWNKLGTFAKRYLKDSTLAISLYQVALRLNPSNAVAMTNLSRALLHIGTSESISEAERWISKAASCADRRFKWWRNVREEIRVSLSEEREQKAKSLPKNFNGVKKLADLRKIFHSIKLLDNPQERGFRFENFVAQLIYLTLGNCKPSYRARLKWSDNSIYQIDAAFCVLDTQYFRVETKWTANPVKPADVVLFREKLDVTGVKGLMISMSGFSDEAITKAVSYRSDREILFMDGEEFEKILNGSPSFDEAIRQKQQYFAIESDPYHKINQAIQEEVD